MKPDNRNDCPPNTHDWQPSAWEPGMEECAWPLCGAVRAASPAPVAGIDWPGQKLVERMRRAA